MQLINYSYFIFVPKAEIVLPENDIVVLANAIGQGVLFNYYSNCFTDEHTKMRPLMYVWHHQQVCELEWFNIF